MGLFNHKNTKKVSLDLVGTSVCLSVPCHLCPIQSRDEPNKCVLCLFQTKKPKFIPYHVHLVYEPYEPSVFSYFQQNIFRILFCGCHQQQHITTNQWNKLFAIFQLKSFSFLVIVLFFFFVLAVINKSG